MLRYIATLLIAAIAAAPQAIGTYMAFDADLIPEGFMAGKAVGQVMGAAITPFLLAAVFVAIWRGISGGNWAEGVFHRRLNWVAIPMIILVILGKAASFINAKNLEQSSVSNREVIISSIN